MPRFFPTAPPKGASRLERLEYLRSYYLRNSILFVPLLIIGVLVRGAVLVVILACIAVSLAGYLTLLVQLRRERTHLR
jgi:hypothetical protein